MLGRGTVLVLAFACALTASQPARAIDAPYQADLVRLAELLGSLHYLRNLCGEVGDTWRGRMEALIASENPDEARKAQLIAGFNRGYRSFDSVYTSCTPSAIEAIERYMLEGETLSKDIAGKYGN